MGEDRVDEPMIHCSNGEDIPLSEYRRRYRAESQRREAFWAKRNSNSPYTAPLLNEMAHYMRSGRSEAMWGTDERAR